LKLSEKLPETFKLDHPEIGWKKMSGMRDRLIHDYFGVDYFIVHDVAINKAPGLRDRMASLIKRGGPNPSKP
jgi:uncharacterized protein with HEPN domain